jgi:hypothetical protein
MNALAGEPMGASVEPRGHQDRLVAAILIGLAIVATAPIWWKEFPLVPKTSTWAGWIFALLVPVACVGVAFLMLTDRPRRRAAIAALLVGLSFVSTDLHDSNVDEAKFFTHYGTNSRWQEDLHQWVLGLEFRERPHSYRFLADCVIRWLELGTGDFAAARVLYRFSFTCLLLAAIYEFAKFYVSANGAIASILLYSAVYPVSIRYYAGQPIDPLSHFTFALTFWALQRGWFWTFAATTFVGVMAKESILVMPLYYLLFRRNGPSHWTRGLLLVAATFGLAIAIRWSVGAGMQFDHVSATTEYHFLTNLADDSHWGRQLASTLGVFIPFVLFGWKNTPWDLKSLILFLAPCLLISGLFFSWLREARNYMPLVALLAVCTARVLFEDHREPRPDEGTVVPRV